MKYDNYLKHTSEIVEAIEEKYDDDVRLQVQILWELFQLSGDNRYKEKAEKIERVHQICHVCGNDLTRVELVDRHGSDYTFDEKVAEYLCKNCR